MATLLEQTRAMHEELEKYERVIALDLAQDTKSHRERLAQSHRVANTLQQISQRATKLRKVYDDSDGQRKDEIASMAGSNVFAGFYDRVKELKEYHRRHPNSGFTEKEDLSYMISEQPWVDFTGEESHGRYLDLHELYQEFVNAKFGRQMEYFEYLQVLTEFNSISRGLRMGSKYKDYVERLFAYMKGFHERTQPLTFLDPIMAAADAEFEEKWAAGEVEGWEEKGAGVTGFVDSTIDLDSFSTPEALLEGVDMETLKTVLQSLGMKTGGTPLQRAQRLFSTKGVPLESLDKKLFVKGAAPVGHDSQQAEKQMTKAKEVALAEVRCVRMREQLAEAVQATLDNVEKKLTRTQQEREAELEEDEYVEDEDEDEDEPIYNPLKLPLGFDGKPIPYWLYKLHGLNQEFKCEICGNTSYWGRRAYERHFREPLHQHGMKSLGLPNTKAFLEVTTIEDAKRLHEALMSRGGGDWVADQEEELEDKDGNVYSRKTYSDLQRQGLV